MKQNIGQNIYIINKYFKIYLKNALNPFQINSAEAFVLLTLYDQLETTDSHFPEMVGFTQEQILEDLHYHKSVMTRTMQSLEKKEFVLRNGHPSDNRCHLFTLTEKAFEFMPRLINILKGWNNVLLHDIENVDAFTAAVDKMTYNAYSKTIGGNENGRNKNKKE